MKKPNAMFEPLSADEKAAADNSRMHHAQSEWTPIHPVPADAPPPAFGHNQLGEASHTWSYRDADGCVLGYMARFDSQADNVPTKEFRPLSYCGSTDGRCRWVWKGFPKPWPLYGLDKLAARPDASVILCEGEKAADGAQARFPEYVAVSPMHGAQSPRFADWAPMAGRVVVVAGDNDLAGEGFGSDVTKLCVEATAASVVNVDWPDSFPNKFDFGDPNPDGCDDDQLRDLLHCAPPASELNDDETVIARLAAMSPLEYDRARQDAAKQMGAQLATVDKLVQECRVDNEISNTDVNDEVALFIEHEPWPNEVDGAELLIQLVAAFENYVVLPDGAATALALWVVHAHCHDAAYISPILTIESPDKRCGKTTTLGVVQALVPKALSTSNISTAALFRAVEKWRPTVLIDEADTFLRDNDELRGVLNSGHNRSSARVIRTVGDDHDPKPFRTWAPKAIALIGEPPATLLDRSIVVPLRRKRPDEKVQRFRMDRVGDLQELARRTARWAEDSLNILRDLDPDVPRALNDRAADNWRALLAIADRVGGDWPSRARDVALALSGDDAVEDASAGTMLLADMQTIFNERGADKITSSDLIAALVDMEDRPWPEWRRGQPIAARSIAKLLKPYEIRPEKWRVGSETERGYLKKDCEDAFGRYFHPISAIPPDLSATTATALKNKGYSDFVSATSSPSVADGSTKNVNENKAVADVADINREAGQLRENTANEGTVDEWRTEL
jgi:putative DNA primase/helicase